MDADHSAAANVRAARVNSRPLIAIAFAVTMLSPAAAEWKPNYALASPEVQAWYRNAQLTPQARERFGFKNCCDHADVFRTKFRVNKISGADEWDYLVDGQWKRIPPDIVHWGVTAPDLQPTLFIYNGKETCFFPGADGN